MIIPDIRPMLLSRSDTSPQGDYIHQLKLDGFRCLLHHDGSKTRLFTRHGIECTAQFPELSLSLPSHAVLDGEMIVLQEGRPCFESVMRRFRAEGEHTVHRLASELPAHLAAFDLLSFRGRDVCGLPLEERQDLLHDFVPKSDVISSVDNFHDGDTLFQAVKQMGCVWQLTFAEIGN